MSLGTNTIWLAYPYQLNLVYMILPYDNISKKNLISMGMHYYLHTSDRTRRKEQS